MNHANQTAVHRQYAAIYADSTARLAATGFPRGESGAIIAFAADDLYKNALQLSDNTEWVLTDDSPVTWAQVGGAGLGGPPSGAAGGTLGGSYPNPTVNTDGSTIETNSNALRVKDDGITNAKLANMAQATIKGRASGAGTGDPTDLTGTQATAILDNVVGDSGSGGTKGLVPAPGAGDAAAGKFLKADGTFAVPSGTGIGGSTGATDNALLRADGTGGATAQASAISVDDTGAITVPEMAAPSPPAAGKVAIYAKSDGKLYIKDDAGTETDLTSIGSSGPTATLGLLPWFGMTQGATNTGAPASNRVNLFRVFIPYNITVNRITVRNSTPDNTKHWGVGLYDMSGNLVLDSGPMTMTGSASNLTATPSSVAITPGMYWLAWTTDSAVATLRSAAMASDLANIICQGTSAIAHATNTGSAGQLPATTGTITLDGFSADYAPQTILQN